MAKNEKLTEATNEAKQIAAGMTVLKEAVTKARKAGKVTGGISRKYSVAGVGTPAVAAEPFEVVQVADLDAGIPDLRALGYTDAAITHALNRGLFVLEESAARGRAIASAVEASGGPVKSTGKGRKNVETL